MNLFFLLLRRCSGWLQKEVKTNAKSTSLKLKKRWFVLTHNSLDYYKSSERNSSKMGTLVLSSLCSIIQPDERVHRETGEEKARKDKRDAFNEGLNMLISDFCALSLLISQVTGTSSCTGGSILTVSIPRC